MRTIARHIIVRGRVQGVSYRASARHEAQRLGVLGWVRNRPDGSVEAWLEGDAEAVAELSRWMHRGPAAAHVMRLEERDVVPRQLRDFDIR